MKTLLLILLLVYGVASSLIADREVRDGVIATSLVRVVADPEEYDGKRVLLIEQIQVLSADRLAAEVEPVADWTCIDAADVFRRWPADRRTQEAEIVWLDDLGREFARLNLKDNKPYAGIEFVAGASDFRSVRVYAEGKVVRHIGFARPGGQEEWELFYDEP